MKNHQEAAAFIWNAADEVLRGIYNETDYGHVILPFVVIRRLDCVLEPTKKAVLDELHKREGKVANLDPFLRRAAGETFYNTSPLTLTTVLGDEGNVKDNLNIYLAGFSPNAREILERFGLSEHIKKLDENELLYRFIGKFTSIDLHPNVVSNTEMGYIFEELLRRTWSNESAGDHYTPREFIRLMVAILLAEDEQVLSQQHAIRSIYDPACGTGGMLAVAEEYLRDLNPNASLEIFGQQLLPETWAICCADMMLKGHDPANIAQGDTLKTDKHRGRRFDYLISNPPFGQDWKKIRDIIERERDELGSDGRFGAGVPPVDDGALLFLQHMISKMKPAADGGSRIAVVFNQAPLVSGDAGQGESEIRRWIIEHDWLEAVIALPDQMFFNTGIYTYIWIVTNRKANDRVGAVQLIDARDMFEPMDKPLGQKRKTITARHQAMILEAYERNADSGHSKIVPNAAFGFQKISTERAMRVRYEVSQDTVDAVAAYNASLATAFKPMIGSTTTDRETASGWITDATRDFTGREVRKLKQLLWASISVLDADGHVALDEAGRVLGDSESRSSDRIPLDMTIDSYLEAMRTHIPDLIALPDKTKIGYEVPITRFFYPYRAPRPMSEIDGDILAIEREVVGLLQGEA
ncbi:MAG: class I SAM-dependent DNA methyltransferase [Chloroflexota bacterium]